MNTCTLECPNCGHQGAHDHLWDPETIWPEPFLAECGGCQGLFVVSMWPAPLSIASPGTPGHVHTTMGTQQWMEDSAYTADDLLARISKATASQWNEYVAHNPAYSGFAPATTEGATQ